MLDEVERWGGGAGGCAAGVEGGGGSETNQCSSRCGLGFCTERCHPQTRAAQSTLSSRTNIEALGETQRQGAQDTASLHCLTLEIGPIGPKGGDPDLGGKRTRRSVSTCGATTQTCVHGSVLGVAAAEGGGIWCLHNN